MYEFTLIGCNYTIGMALDFFYDFYSVRFIKRKQIIGQVAKSLENAINRSLVLNRLKTRARIGEIL
ncbi:hypothetical protein GCM10010911_19140 [Paenibacillus nasutitermitis]|uniref:Uncharacterized protein n=1 Tax=Paenibacillus nasutitermitis TaxID=1652958 RepID=A0A916YUU3_9BACL|nr:hypothetical protein GCM10010911_19140 [Paenibacillus nasutitermitis]